MVLHCARWAAAGARRRVWGSRVSGGSREGQLWREWRQTNGSRLAQILSTPRPTGEPLPIRDEDLPGAAAVEDSAHPAKVATNVPPRRLAGEIRYKALRTARGYVSDQVGLIVPTSLCASQIGRMIADKLTREAPDGGMRYVALAHTEGCGVSGGESELLYLRTMAGYLAHPLVRKGLLLEHGCEKTLNDAMRNFLDEQNIDQTRFGWASIQLDGGLESVTAKVMKWFQTAIADDGGGATKDVGLEAVRLGLTAVGLVPETVARGCAELGRRIVSSGGTVVVPQNSALLAAPGFAQRLFSSTGPRPSLAYGQRFAKAGFHIMETPTDHQVETLTGLGATGVEVMLAHTSDRCLQAHPMIPLLQIGSLVPGPSSSNNRDDLDWVIDSDGKTPAAVADDLVRLMVRVLSREYTPKSLAQGNTDFQMTRGLLGVSL